VQIDNNPFFGNVPNDARISISLNSAFSAFSAKARLFLIDYSELQIQRTTDNQNTLQINLRTNRKKVYL